MTANDIGTVAILGGTGKEGSGLALRWARAGVKVIIGSRQAEKAQQAAADLNAQLGQDVVLGTANDAAAAQGDVIVLTVPYSAHLSTLASVRPALAGKTLIDVTVPIDPKQPRRATMPPAGSATKEAQDFLGDAVKVVAAFQNISHLHLREDAHAVDCDVLVCGNDADAKAIAIRLAELAGMRGLDAGPVENAMVVEGLTSVLLSINRRYNMKDGGIRITGSAFAR